MMQNHHSPSEFLEGGTPLIVCALLFAEECHAGQKRRDGRDYIVHPQEVLETLMHRGVYTDIRGAKALVHDVVEELRKEETMGGRKAVTFEDVEKVFGAIHGPSISHTTWALTDGTPEEVLNDVDAIIIKPADVKRNTGDYLKSGTLRGADTYSKQVGKKWLPVFRKAAILYPEYTNYFQGMIEDIETNLFFIDKYVAAKSAHLDMMRSRRNLKEATDTLKKDVITLLRIAIYELGTRIRNKWAGLF